MKYLLILTMLFSLNSYAEQKLKTPDELRKRTKDIRKYEVKKEWSLFIKAINNEGTFVGDTGLVHYDRDLFAIECPYKENKVKLMNEGYYILKAKEYPIIFISIYPQQEGLVDCYDN